MLCVWERGQVERKGSWKNQEGNFLENIAEWIHTC